MHFQSIHNVFSLPPSPFTSITPLFHTCTPSGSQEAAYLPKTKLLDLATAKSLKLARTAAAW